jgi:hypothetical protein
VNAHRWILSGDGGQRIRPSYAFVRAKHGPLS